MRSTAVPVVGRSPRGRLHVGTSRVPLALFEGALASDGGAVRVRAGARAPPLSPEPERVPAPADDDPPLDDEPPPRVTAVPPPPPLLEPDDRGAAFWPPSPDAYAMPLL
ncbi:MAG TPA: hypothetical protein VF921_19020 [Vicinamibacterales bacterium]